jgi:hypothetical protein
MVVTRSHILNSRRKPGAAPGPAAYRRLIMRSVFVLIDCRGEA